MQQQPERHIFKVVQGLQALGMLILLGAGQAQAQYTNIINGQQFNSAWAAYGGLTVSQAIQRSMVMSTLTGSTTSGSNAPSTTSAPVNPTVYKYEMSKTDFKFQGIPTQQKNCAALAQTPEYQKQLSDACLAVFNYFLDMPDFRKNNLAAGLTVLIGLSLQVTLDQELGDDETEALQRGLNDLLVESGVLTKMQPAEVQAMYETSVMTGGLIAAIAQAGVEENDPEAINLAKTLAKTVLTSFSFKG